MIAGLAAAALPGTLFAARLGSATTGIAGPPAAAAKLVVSGRLVDANGKPLAGAHIETLDGRADAAASVTTDADGRFVLTSLTPGASSPHLRYRVSHAQHATIVRQLELPRTPGAGGDVALQRDAGGTWRAAIGVTLA